MKRILEERKLSTKHKRSVASFLRSSWVQVPDRTSDSRLMRPLYVAKQDDEVDVPETVVPISTQGSSRVDPGSIPGEVVNSKTKIKSTQRQNEQTLPTISAAYVSGFLSCFSRANRTLRCRIFPSPSILFAHLLMSQRRGNASSTSCYRPTKMMHFTDLLRWTNHIIILGQMKRLERTEITVTRSRLSQST